MCWLIHPVSDSEWPRLPGSFITKNQSPVLAEGGANVKWTYLGSSITLNSRVNAISCLRLWTWRLTSDQVFCQPVLEWSSRYCVRCPQGHPIFRDLIERLIGSTYSCIHGWDTLKWNSEDTQPEVQRHRKSLCRLPYVLSLNGGDTWSTQIC